MDVQNVFCFAEFGLGRTQASLRPREVLDHEQPDFPKASPDPSRDLVMASQNYDSQVGSFDSCLRFSHA